MSSKTEETHSGHTALSCSMSGKTGEQPTLAELLESDLLRCPQCQQHLTSPTLLPCLHAFCASCVAALPSHDVTNGNDVKLVELRCPVCQSAVTTPKDAPPVAFLQSLCQLRAFKHGNTSRTCCYCKFDGKTETADSLCLDCADDMCDSCALAHRKTRVTRDHVIAPYDQIRKGLYDHDIRASLAACCARHKLHYDHYCCDCLALACKHCETVAHRGHHLESCEAAVSRLQPEAKSFVQGLRKRIPAVSEYQAFLHTQLAKLKDSQTGLSDRVKQQADAIHSLVDQFRDSLLQDIHAAFDREESDIQSRITDMSVAKKSLESNAQFLGSVLSVGSPSEVLALHPALMARLKQLIQLQPHALTQRLSPTFHCGPANQQNMRIMFGTLDMEKVAVDEDRATPKARLSVSTLLPEPLDPPQLVCSVSLKADSDVKEVWPSGLHVHKEKVVVVDRDNKKVKILDSSTSPPTLTFQFCGKGEHKLLNPFDAVLLENGVVVVTDTGAEKIKVYDVTGRWIGDLGGECRHPRGLATTRAGQVVVVDGLLLQLTVHDPETGRVVSTIPSKGQAKVLVDPFYVAVTEQDHLVVTDHAAPNIKVFGLDGLHLATYGTYGTSVSNVLKPYGVCVDKYGQLLVADSDNQRVHLLLPDGTFSRFLLTHQHKVSHPVTLAIDKDGHLVVGEAYGQLKVFKYM